MTEDEVFDDLCADAADSLDLEDQDCYVVIQDYSKQDVDELDMFEGQVVYVIDDSDKGKLKPTFCLSVKSDLGAILLGAITIHKLHTGQVASMVSLVEDRLFDGEFEDGPELHWAAIKSSL